MSINPDEAVAYGAVLHVALPTKGKKFVPNLVLLDVTPLSIGISLNGDLMSVVIPRNTTIPVVKKKGYKRAEDFKSSVPIKVYKGERRRASDNNLLGFFNLNGNPKALRGYPLTECFCIDADDDVDNPKEKTKINKAIAEAIKLLDAREQTETEVFVDQKCLIFTFPELPYMHPLEYPMPPST
ncbi:heat shock cognate 70 kDa protein 2-like [Vigna radiata var. radiata]|uniref:Heat shock cognate 70 kDa protein 2-like n=1 Tax=Vigna radiata var. radiata TaxID=3916 RepID=A0A1S3TSZ9_VIGRR|nr:heat shock cognate 70 kDa protein 2-like [Vigna radiata var. radiata]